MRTALLITCTACACLAVEDEGAVLVITGERLHGNELRLPVLGAGGGLGEALRELPGVEAVRMGGHGLDPVLRGQQQERIDVSLDGARFHGGCPNRMDPPSSYLPSELVGRIVVTLGLRSLLGAAPAPGGAVRAERLALPAAGGELEGSLRGASNGPGGGVAAHGGYGEEHFGFRLRADYQQADDYQDGQGDEVHSQYTSYAAGAGLGGKRGAWSWRADLDYSAGEDIAYAGARMDAPETELLLFQGQGRYAVAEGVLRAVELRASHGMVEHVMDNFSLRDVPVMGGTPRYMRADSTTDTTTLEVQAELQLFARPARIGLSWLRIDRWAERYAGPTSAVPMLQSVLWPEVVNDRLGLTIEQDAITADDRRLTLGLRLDLVDREAASADTTVAGGGSPDQLYTLYYGHDSEAAESAVDVGLLVRYEQDLGDRATFSLAASRALRPADASEAFMAAGNPNPGMRWVGDPGLDDEVHYQLELDLQLRGDDWRLAAALAYDQVEDWILRDRARGQSGILQADGASIYRNVAARLISGELRGDWRFLPDWELSGHLAHVVGDNTDDHRPLAQMPPLGGELALDWQFRPDWSARLALPWAAEQNRVDRDSGLDVDETPAWATLSLSCEARLDEHWSAAVGADNLLDKHYATHLNKAGAFDPTVERVYEPGRAFWARLGGRF